LKYYSGESKPRLSVVQHILPASKANFDHIIIILKVVTDYEASPGTLTRTDDLLSSVRNNLQGIEDDMVGLYITSNKL